uniref:Uncharacterized protein n=1 Tax=Heterorhabditis bacteriophora TaxID=37862 RepID=A0A1I7WV27_HETBA
MEWSKLLTSKAVKVEQDYDLKREKDTLGSKEANDSKINIEKGL